jgi:hypothetical protein
MLNRKKNRKDRDIGVWEYGSMGVWEYGSMGVWERNPRSLPPYFHTPAASYSWTLIKDDQKKIRLFLWWR